MTGARRTHYALAEIGSTRAIGPLKARLADTAPGAMRVASALALRLLGDDSGRDAAIDVLHRGEFPTDRQSAVSALALFSGISVDRALERAIDDPDSGVRSASAGMLIELHGLKSFNRTYQDRLGLLQNRCSSPLATVRADALAELRDIFTRHQRGESPEELGLTWLAADDRPPLQAFSESLRGREPPWQDDFAVDVVAQLTGTERTWAEDCLWHFLPTDPRAARAFARLGVPRAIAALRELLPMATGIIAIEVAAALW
jgi:PBS lyase HEAT-like repeat